jgi:hypothetical protein
VPVTASAASAKAAIRVLNDMGCSIRFAAADVADMHIGRSPSGFGSTADANFRLDEFPDILGWLI